MLKFNYKGVSKTMDKIKVLAKYLDISEDEIKQTYDENHFETEDGEEYIVCDYDTAKELAEEDVRECYDEMGLEAFSKDYQDYILDNCVDESWFVDALREEADYMYSEDNMSDDEIYDEAKGNGLVDDVEEDDADIDDLREQLTDKYYDDYSDDPIGWYKDNFDDEAFVHAVKDNDLVDIDAIARDCILTDGIAHFIATYDGDEIELEGDLYAYRVN